MRCKYDWDTTYSRCTYAVTADLDTSYIRSFTTQSRSPPIRWRYTYDDDDPDTMWAALGTLMLTSLHSGYDLIGDICPDHINICADHCRSLVHAHRYHGSSIRCPAFWFIFLNRDCHSRATDCPALLFRWWSIVGWTDRTVGKTQIEQIISRTAKKIAMLSEQFGASSVEYITLSGNGRMGGINFLIDVTLILRGHCPCTVLS